MVHLRLYCKTSFISESEQRIKFILFLGYARSGKLIFQMALESNIYYPIWGTCMGTFQTKKSVVVIMIKKLILIFITIFNYHALFITRA